jgi:predicted  nucleic acid-binding Zn-ribbon protein
VSYCQGCATRDQHVDVLVAERDHWKRVCEETEDRFAEVRARCEIAERGVEAMGARVDELRSLLAAAQRVPEDAELDVLVARCDEVANDWSLGPGEVRNQLEAAADAITALRRRVAKLEAEQSMHDAGESA